MTEMDRLKIRVTALRDAAQAQIDEGKPYSHLWYLQRVTALNEVIAMIDQELELDHCYTCANCDRPRIHHIQGYALVGDPTYSYIHGVGHDLSADPNFKLGTWCPGRIKIDGEWVQTAWESRP